MKTVALFLAAMLAWLAVGIGLLVSATALGVSAISWMLFTVWCAIDAEPVEDISPCLSILEREVV
ncbi:MAG: hypothetical protein ACFFD3_04570 [Candidatus Thorarchaeota archaeon]